MASPSGHCHVTAHGPATCTHSSVAGSLQTEDVHYMLMLLNGGETWNWAVTGARKNVIIEEARGQGELPGGGVANSSRLEASDPWAWRGQKGPSWKREWLSEGMQTGWDEQEMGRERAEELMC